MFHSLWKPECVTINKTSQASKLLNRHFELCLILCNTIGVASSHELYKQPDTQQWFCYGQHIGRSPRKLVIVIMQEDVCRIKVSQQVLTEFGIKSLTRTFWICSHMLGHIDCPGSGERWTTCRMGKDSPHGVLHSQQRNYCLRSYF